MLDESEIRLYAIILSHAYGLALSWLSLPTPNYRNIVCMKDIDWTYIYSWSQGHNESVHVYVYVIYRC